MTRLLVAARDLVMDGPLSTFGARLQAARLLAPDLSARELDRLAHTTEGHAGAVEGGAYEPKIGNASAWAAVLGASLDWLVDGQGEPPTAKEVAAAVALARAEAAKPKRTSRVLKRVRNVRRTSRATS